MQTQIAASNLTTPLRIEMEDASPEGALRDHAGDDSKLAAAWGGWEEAQAAMERARLAGRRGAKKESVRVLGDIVS